MSNEYVVKYMIQQERLANIADELTKRLDCELVDNGCTEGVMHYINALSGIYIMVDKIEDHMNKRLEGDVYDIEGD